jgi:hypothetical protein
VTISRRFFFTHAKDFKESGSEISTASFFDLIDKPMNENKQPMAHEEAEKTNAVESYLLNELTGEQRSRFEEHYFECTTCADAVMAGQVFIQGIRPPDPWWKSFAARLGDPVSVPFWRLWAMGGAAAASLLFLVMQNSSVSFAPNTAILAIGLEKSQSNHNIYALTTPSATVEVVPDDPETFPFYRMTIARDNHDIVWQILPAPAKQAGRRLSLQVAAKALGIGDFTVTLAGLERPDAVNPQQLATTYHFSIAKAN